MAESCMTERNKLTNREEAEFADWFVRSVRERPEDFIVGNHTVTDKKSGIEVWTANGIDCVAIWAPVHTAYFGKKYQQAIWRCIHELRHRAGSEQSLAIRKLMASVPVAEGEPAVAIPLDEFDRTEPEVAKLRRMVNAIAASPMRVAAAISFLAILVAGAALAG